MSIKQKSRLPQKKWIICWKNYHRKQLEELKRNCMLQKVMQRKTTVMTEQNEVVDEQRRIQRIQDKIKRNDCNFAST